MKMTRKQFEFIAATIKSMPGSHRRRAAVAVEFAAELEKTNERFDADRFMTAALGHGYIRNNEGEIK